MKNVLALSAKSARTRSNPNARNALNYMLYNNLYLTLLDLGCVCVLFDYGRTRYMRIHPILNVKILNERYSVQLIYPGVNFLLWVYCGGVCT